MDQTPNNNKYNVLFGDSFGYRHAMFRVRKGTQDVVVIQNHVHNIKEFLDILPTRKWEAVFIPQYFEQNTSEAAQKVIKAFASLEDEIQPNLVVFHGQEDPFQFIPALRIMGIPSVMMPWDFMKPSSHIRKETSKSVAAWQHVKLKGVNERLAYLKELEYI